MPNLSDAGLRGMAEQPYFVKKSFNVFGQNALFKRVPLGDALVMLLTIEQADAISNALLTVRDAAEQRGREAQRERDAAATEHLKDPYRMKASENMTTPEEAKGFDYAKRLGVAAIRGEQG